MRRLMKALIGVLIGLVVVFGCVLIPCLVERLAVIDVVDSRTMSCMNVKQIVYAIHAYHADHHHLPAAVVLGKHGEPLYSWRVLLLPYLDEADVYNQFKLDEPWNSPHNKKLSNETPRTFAMDAVPGLTHYQVFVGPGTAFERPGLTFKDFPDGLGNTIFVVEAKEPVPWSKPIDLVYDPNGPLPAFGTGLSNPVHFLCYEVGRRPGFFLGFGDGLVRFATIDQEERVLRGLITRNGGESVSRDDLR